ncbi:hypothetical protein CGCF413_v004464 [Colletotrichum fructicola]|nr:hypothetical protein CGCF413_v004464 [Colletotrichum fructicola]
MATVRYNHPASSGDLIPRIDAPESGSRQEPTKVAKSRLPAKMPALSRTHSFPGSRRTHSSVDLTAERSELGSGLFYGPNRYVGSEVGLHGQDHKDLHMPIIIHEDMSDLIDHRFDTSNEPTNTDTSTVLAAIRGQGLPPTKDLPKSIPEPSEITDHGHQRYNELKNEKLVPWFPVDDNELEGNLSDRILEASCENSQDRQEFLPKSQLDRLIHPSSVRLELRRWLPRLTEDKIRSYANRICHGRAETIDKSTTEDLVKSYQKVFAVLVLVNKVDTIELFLGENVCDADLPLQRYTRKKDAERRKVELRRKKQPGRRLDCFRLWDQAAIRNFEKYQWAVVPPFFTKGKRKNVQHYVLEPSTVLPFIFTENASSGRRGGYSRVFEADIHPDHHNFNGPQRNEQDTSEPSQNTFAIKRLQDLTSKEAFQKEVQILKRFSGDTHPHLISLLATFERSGVFYLIFPWAGADLKTYWKSKNPRPTHDADTVIWMAEQCSGLAEGLTKLHQYETGLNDKTESPKKDFLAPNVVLNGGKDSGRPGPLYGRHGDIKPENILWFPDSKVSCHKGTLKISDFGLSELNSRYKRMGGMHVSMHSSSQQLQSSYQNCVRIHGAANFFLLS